MEMRENDSEKKNRKWEEREGKRKNDRVQRERLRWTERRQRERERSIHSFKDVGNG